MLQIKNNIEITNNDIKYAENILLKKWESFDTERKDFIKNLDTIDLQAVPWSWKTTALLAKLLILGKKMPFPDGSGILVLSHTNTAVDEIKEKLWKIAPKLFEFPNFIWTIQEFVNTFLAKPYWVNYLGIRFQHIDTDYYESLCYIWYNWWLDKRWDKENILKKSVKDTWGNLFYLDWGDFPIKDNTKDLYKKILKIKYDILNKWIISYDEAYYYWDLYIQKFSKIIKILQNRFKFVFVDEMQDMDEKQNRILEKLFYKKKILNHCFQRIGDINQAIYSWKKISEKFYWKNIKNRKTLKIRGSHRLTQKVSKVVQNFWLNYVDITWKRKINGLDNRDISKKPMLLIYNNSHLNDSESSPIVEDNKILEKFSDIIKKKKDEWYFEGVEKIVSKAIIWNAKPQEKWFKIEQCRAKHYFYDYDNIWAKSKYKTWFKKEKDYLVYYDKEDKSYKSKYNNIVRLFLKILRKYDIKNDNEKYFNKISLLKYLQEKDLEKYKNFKEQLFVLSKELNSSNVDYIAWKLDTYFGEVLDEIFGEKVDLKIEKSEPSTDVDIVISSDKINNIYTNNDIDIEVCTVHSVKWETHTCTLYMESSNNKKYETDFCLLSWNVKSYIIWKYDEIQILEQEISELKWWRWTKTKKSNIKTIETEIENIKKATKMLYVWLSRPTHLLCYAIHENRYNKLLEEDVWNESKIEKLWKICKL